MESGYSKPLSMENTIQGKLVAADLLEAIENPHVVPVQLQGEDFTLQARDFDDVPPVSGTLNGRIKKHDAKCIPMFMRDLVRSILNHEVGRTLASSGKTLRSRMIDVLGRELVLNEGVGHNDGVFLGEIQARIERPASYPQDVSLPQRGYVIPEQVLLDRKGHRHEAIAADTEGHWISSVIASGNGSVERLKVIDKKPNGELLLGDAEDDGLPTFKNKLATYRNDFLPVAAPSRALHNRQPLAHRLAIVLQMCHILRTVHLTCVGEIRDDKLAFPH